MQDKRKYYQKILEKQSKAPNALDFATPAKELIDKLSGTINDTFLCTTAQVTAPVLTSYVLWVLRDAIKSNIKTLLFVARDGYVMYKIATALCKHFGWDIDCRYFYASRQSLRLPLYAIDKTYALSKHCDPNSENYTTHAILTAAGLSASESNDVMKEISARARTDVKTQLEKSQLFDRYALLAASKALDEAKGYFSQTVPDNPCSFALVDSGWSGSIQESFGKLYHFFTGYPASSIRGYYFGIVTIPPTRAGVFKSYFFSPRNKFRRFRRFSIDLFECLCAAEGGRTLGYRQESGKWLPVLESEGASCSGCWDAKTQIDMCTEYAELFSIKNTQAQNFSDISCLNYHLLRSFMHRPSKEEASVYGKIPFSRGVLESNMSTLARRLTDDEIKQYTLTWRLWRIITLKRNNKPLENPVFWMPGAIALSEGSWLQKINVQLLLFTYWIKIGIKSFIKNKRKVASCI